MACVQVEEEESIKILEQTRQTHNYHQVSIFIANLSVLELFKRHRVTANIIHVDFVICVLIVVFKVVYIELR